MKRVVSSINIINYLNSINVSEYITYCTNSIINNYDFNGKIAFICGDHIKGYVTLFLAYRLCDKCDCHIFLNDTFNNLIIDKCNEKKISINVINDNTMFYDFDIIIDGLLDSLKYNSIDQYNENIINKINSSNNTVISIDINSGMNPINGIGKTIVKSNTTFSLISLRYGHFLNMSKDYIGKLINYNLNINIDGNCNLLELSDFKDIIKDRKHYSNKYDYGLVSIIGGSNSYSGSVKLCNMALASLRSGVGLARLCVPKSIGNAVISNVVESSIYPMPCRDGQMIFSAYDLSNVLNKSTCLVVGLGWGESEEYYKILEFIFTHFTRTIVLDADGINTISKMNLDLIKNYQGKVVLTPHLKEFSRLIGKDVNVILDNPVYEVERFSKEYNCITLLKGPTNIISDGENTFLVNRGTPGQATAGSGDVLDGILGGILSYNDTSILSVGVACYINGLAGEEAEKEIGSISMIASDTVRNIPKAIKKMEKAIEIIDN